MASVARDWDLAFKRRNRRVTMDCHLSGRTFFPRAYLVAVLTIGALPCRAATADSPTAPTNASTAVASVDSTGPAIAVVRAMRNDAALNDICFTSSTGGWAVGDRGVIWHTDDSGKTWNQ